MRMRIAAAVAGGSLEPVGSTGPRAEVEPEDGFEVRLGNLEHREDMTPAVMMARLLRAEQCPEDAIVVALDANGGWIEKVLALEALGAARKVWRNSIEDDSSYPARVVRKAVARQAQGPLTLMVARCLKHEGPMGLAVVMEGVEAWWREVTGLELELESAGHSDLGESVAATAAAPATDELADEVSPGEGPEEPGGEPEGGGLNECPRCRSALTRQYGQKSSFLKCSDIACSFTVMLDGERAIERQCEACELTIYQNRRGKYLHVSGKCLGKSAEAA